MELNEALKKVSVIGAAGKMGRGIASLLLQEMALLDLGAGKNEENDGFVLQLIDVNDQALYSLRLDLKDHLIKYAEKNINALRQKYANEPGLVSNADIVEAFAERGIGLIRYETEYEEAKDSYLVFEAIVENIEIKVKVFSSLVQKGCKGYFLTNTSSIPISVLNQKAGLNNRIIGFHFYYPPAVQKLVEIIIPPPTDPSLCQMAYELANRLQKITVSSADVAGFIGNGQFIREIMFTCQKVHELQREFSQIESIYMINRLTQEWLIRPMGTFQLLDIVGVDVCQKVCEIMQTYLGGETFHDDLIEAMNDAGMIGGQYPNGLQKNGFFQYEGNVPVGIYSLQDHQYHLFSHVKWKENDDGFLGPLPEGYVPWKLLHKDPQKNTKLEAYFHSLFEYDTFGAELAQVFLFKSRDFAQGLVERGVAKSIEDVNTVMMNGFFHLYGPQNPWMPERVTMKT